MIIIRMTTHRAIGNAYSSENTASRHRWSITGGMRGLAQCDNRNAADSITSTGRL
ncbi:hypothetical protein [Saccharothrix xinjiangensis]|uniref:hypothetical protein n=1 Tax=Saccharothrix xinjiangensis TaxID=204798 RepID=UPI0031D62B49